MSVAKTILSQIKTIAPTAMWAWGANSLVDTKGGLQFKVGGLAKFKGYVHVKLDEANDLYDIEFFKVRKSEVKVANAFKGIYADELVDIIDSIVQ
jgi:hypothetical protein